MKKGPPRRPERRALDDGRNIRYVEQQHELLNAAPFDRILCFMVLLCNEAQAADELLRTLYSLARPGALLGLANTDTTTLGRRFPDFFSTPPAIPTRGAPYQSNIPTSAGLIKVTDHYYSPEHLRDMLSASGFELLTEERVAEPFILHVGARPEEDSALACCSRRASSQRRNMRRRFATEASGSSAAALSDKRGRIEASTMSRSRSRKAASAISSAWSSANMPSKSSRSATVHEGIGDGVASEAIRANE